MTPAGLDDQSRTRTPRGRAPDAPFKPLPPWTIERWLLEADLATRAADGRLTLTRRGRLAASALDTLG